MGANPDVDLLEASLQSFLVIAEEVVSRRRRRHVDDQAKKQVAQNSEVLLKYEVSMDAEPAFQFKA